MNHIVVDVSLEEGNGERVNHSDLFDRISETCNEKPKNSDLLNPMVENEDGDDDCVILDCDPMANDTAIDTCEIDEVLVVGQKGELPQNWASPVTQFGVRACSTATRVSTHPNVYIRPGYKNQQSKSFPQNLESQPCSAQSLPNYKRLSYNGNPQVVSSNPYTSNRGVSRRINRVQYTAQGLQPTHYASPAVSQGNSQRILTGYISTVPESHSKVYASRNMYSVNVQRVVVPSQTLNLPVNQQQQQQKQQSGRSNDKVLLQFEEWLLDDSTLSGPVSPLPGQDDATAFASDFESFLND